jgi:GR25 family glycosyltransferase involved in LPS biosynthesis
MLKKYYKHKLMNLNNVHARFINLDRRIDRYNETIQKLYRLGFIKDNIKKFSAIDGKNLINDLKNKNYSDNIIFSAIKNVKLNYKTCEFACLLSHYFLLNEIKNDSSINDNSIVFVFEDDFFVNENYLNVNPLNEILNKLNKFNNIINGNWNMIYFGGRFTINFIPFNFAFFKNIYENFYLKFKGFGYDVNRTTHCYVVKKNNVEKICNAILNNFIDNPEPIMAIDKFYECSNLIMYDYFPHIFYSPANYTSDIQFSNTIIKTNDINFN